MKGRVASAYAASAGRAEGNELLAGEIIAFQEGIDDPGTTPHQIGKPTITAS